ncbi:MAG: methyl-accepting chemotaxis protein [Acetobacteraceae bacterium]|nr:methyl-accepting chemotaxis protein [Acetobacteraceae bacterium]
MQALRYPRIALRLQFIVATALLALAVLAGLAAFSRYNAMYEGRVDKFRSLVQSAASMATTLQQRVAAGQLSQQQALTEFRDTLRPIRFDGDTGYFFAYGMDGTTLILGPTPTAEGSNRLDITDARGNRWVQAQIDIAKAGGGTMVYYYPKPGATEASPKLAYVLPIPAWNMYVASGVYIDDLHADFLASLAGLGALVAILLLTTAGVAWWVGRGIQRPLGRLQSAMVAISAGDLQTTVPETERRDEVGEMAATLLVFRNAMAAERLATEHDRQRQTAEAGKQAAMRKMAAAFEGEVGQLTGLLSSSSAELEATAQSMSATATQTNHQAAAVASAAAEANAGVQTAAVAAEELTASIAEISRQVTQSAKVAGQAVEKATRTDVIVRALADGARKIEQVVDLIANIAGQTNLLALNATIEAARAGDAGKGFAVVASEVKSLAQQTAKATEDVGTQIGHIQAATDEAVKAIREIASTIEEVSAIATNIASAVDEQGAATAEIARNVQQAAASTQEVTANIGLVSEAANDTGAASNQVLTAAGGMSRQSGKLSDEVNRFLAAILAA